MKVVCIVQARMGSSRLPNKMMLWFNDYPVIEWIRKRINTSVQISNIIFAIPDTKDNDILEIYLKSKGETVFRGSEQNVLGRFYEASLLYPSEAVIRVCADNPFVSGNQIDILIEHFKNNKCDYAYNHIPKNNKYPDGIGAEICTVETLEKINRNAQKASQREHIFNYIWDNQSDFSIKTFDPLQKELYHPELKMDIDTMEDYMRLLRLNISPDIPDSELILRFCQL